MISFMETNYCHSSRMPGDGGLDEYIVQSVGGVCLEVGAPIRQLESELVTSNEGEICWSVEYFYSFCGVAVYFL